MKQQALAVVGLVIGLVPGLVSMSAAEPAAGPKAPDPKYAAIDAARATLVTALDSGDATAFAALLDASAVQVTDVWFDSAKCRKQWKAKSLDAKSAPAFVACMKGLGVRPKGLNIYYGPGVALTARFDYIDGRAVLRKLSGDPVAADPAHPTVSGKDFESHRTEGSPVALDQSAREELDELGDTGVVMFVCADAKGAVKAKSFMPRVARKGPTAAAVNTALATWKVEPFLVRGKAATACAAIVVK